MTREQLDLCGVWRFQPDPIGDGEARGYPAPTHNTARWSPVVLPATFDRLSPALAHYEGGGWFAREVVVPASWAGRRVVLRCQGANYHAKVWINSALVGENRDGFLPFDLRVDPVLRCGERNTLLCYVDNRRLKGEVPGEQRGWRPFGGILRELALEATAPLHVAAAAVTALPAPGGGSLVLSVTVANATPRPARATLRATVSAATGATLAELGPVEVATEADGATELTLAASVPGVTLWSPQTPALYGVRVWLEGELGHAAVDELTLGTGFRSIEVRDERLWLNGQPLWLTGFNRHEDSPRTDMATDLETARQDLLDMKDAGANFVRLCHYPHHPGELDLCDELGLLAMDEIPLYWWNGLEEGAENCARKLEAAKRQVTRMIARDRHHPALIFWSVSNETHEQHPEVAAGNRALVELARALDSTRLAVHVSDHWREAPNFAADDVICLNAYPALSGSGGYGVPERSLADATAWWREWLARMHALYPSKPILITEFGYCSLEGCFGGAYGEDEHARVLEAELAGMDAPSVCGATIWCWADHPWPEVAFLGGSVLTTSPFGVVSRERRKLEPYWAARRLFRARQGLD